MPIQEIITKQTPSIKKRNWASPEAPPLFAVQTTALPALEVSLSWLLWLSRPCWVIISGFQAVIIFRAISPLNFCEPHRVICLRKDHRATWGQHCVCVELFPHLRMAQDGSPASPA